MFHDDGMLGRMVRTLAKGCALTGGAVLVAVIAITTISILGRALMPVGLRPITGDYELSSAGVAFAVFAFLPWAHLERGHAVVTLLTDRFSARVNAWILVATDAMMLATAMFIAWRLWFGMEDKFAYGETTLLLRIPLGWPYAAAMAGASVFVIVAFYVCGRSIANALFGRTEAATPENAL